MARTLSRKNIKKAYRARVHRRTAISLSNQDRFVQNRVQRIEENPHILASDVIRHITIK